MDDEYDAYDTYQPDEFEEDFKTPTRPSSTNAAALQKILHNMDEEPVQRSASPEKSAATPMPQIQVTPQMIRRVFNAATKGDTEAVRAFLEQGCPGTVVNENDVPLIYAAAESGTADLVELLSYEATPDQISQALHGAARFGKLDCCTVLVNQGADLECTDKDGARPLHWAAQGGSHLAVKYLIEAGCNIEGLAKYDSTPLHIAARGGHVKVVSALLEARANIEAPTSYKYTPLHVATMKGHELVVRALLENGANVHARTNTGLMALHVAAMQGLGAIINLLLQYGTVVTAKDAKGKTAAQYAMEQGKTDVGKMLMNLMQRQSQAMSPVNKRQSAVSPPRSGMNSAAGYSSNVNQAKSPRQQRRAKSPSNASAGGSSTMTAVSPRGQVSPRQHMTSPRDAPKEVKDAIPDGITIKWSKPRKLPPGITEADLQDLIGTTAAHPIALPTSQDFEAIRRAKATIPDGIKVQWSKPKPPPEILAMLNSQPESKPAKARSSMGGGSSRSSPSLQTVKKEKEKEKKKKEKKGGGDEGNEGKKVACPFCGNSFSDLHSHMTDCVVLKTD